MNKNRILLTGIIILFLLCATTPASAIMAVKIGDGVSRGDYDTLALYEAKDTWKQSESSEYVSPWVSISPGSSLVCNGGTNVAYRYRLLTPERRTYDKVVYDSSFDAGNGLLLSGNQIAFLKDKAVRWFKVSSLIDHAKDKGFAWQGMWTMEFYFGDYDCTKSEYNGWNLVSTKTFTLVEDTASTTTAPATTAAVTTTALMVTPPSTSGQVPAIIDYGVSENNVGTKKISWGPGDSGQNLVAWIKITPGSAIVGGQERYTVRYRLLKPDGAAYYDNLNQGNAMSFNPDGSADMIQYPVSEFLAYPGNWKVEYYIQDASTGTTTLVNTQGFTITGSSTVTPTATVMPRNTPATTQQVRVPTTMTTGITQPPQPFNICSGSGPSVYAESRTMQQGKTVTIPVMVCNAQDVANMDMSITYDTRVLSFSSATKGSLNSNSLFESNEPSKGTVKISFASSSGFSGSGSIAFLTFNVIGSSSSASPITLRITTASTSSGQSLTIPVTNGNFVVGTPTAGDIDGDNQLTARDALAALQISVGKRTADMVLDVTGDGSVNSMDAQKILKMIVKKA